MSSCVKLTRFELRRNLASVWTSTNPILLAGEPGVETDTGQMKVGNGTDRWNSLVYVGKGGGGATGPLGFIKSSDNIYGTGLSYQRDLVTFYEDGGPKTIRKWLTYQHKLTREPMFAVQLADFSPSFSSTTLPSSSLNWDVACTGFSVSVNNPSDFLTQYISSVHSVEQTSGTVSTLSNFTPGTRSPTPAGGVDWTQTFSTNATGVIRSTSTTIAGGMASANIRYNSFSGTESLYTASNSTISVTWATPGLGISTTPLSGRTFLKTYTSTPYSISVSGINVSSNYVHTVSGTQGSISNPLGNGTLTFTTPIHKDNTGTNRRVSTSTTFTRPAAVTGTSYSVVLTASSTVSASFTYPSFWLFTSGIPTLPVLSDIVSGSDFATGVTELGNQTRTFEEIIDNKTVDAIAFWFGVKADVPQPGSFQTGSLNTDGTVGLLSGVEFTKATDPVDLKPASLPAGYNSVSYALYGITLQPGKVYVKIT